MNLNFSKISFILLFLSLVIKIKSEIIQAKIFYDKDWTICKSDQAFYYRLCGWDNEKHLFEGDFSDYLLNDTKIVQGKYEQGKKNGTFIFYYESGLEKIRTFFKYDTPDDLWFWYFPNKQLNFKIKFEQEQFRFIELNDENGNSLFNIEYKFTLEFQNDRLNTNTQIKGIIDHGLKEGKWIIVNNNRTLGYDLYKKDKYIKTKLENGIYSQNKRIINISIFIPYSIFACERLNYNVDVTETDYPFLSDLLNSGWEPIESAFGIIGDSSIFQIERKPMYKGGVEGLNKTISLNLKLTIEYFEKCRNFGYAYYQILIDEKGSVIKKEIISSPDKIITEIALKSLDFLERFKPAYNNGIPIKSKFISRIKFEKTKIIR
jgi:hypothetical protein